jgi:DNA-binding transcriptional ArsR family regulator
MALGDSPDAVLRALSDVNRREVFERLHRNGEQSVAQVTAGLGISQPAVSRHLRILSDEGLVEARREGRQRFYRATSDAVRPLADWLNGLSSRRKPFDATEWLRADYAKRDLAAD